MSEAGYTGSWGPCISVLTRLIDVVSVEPRDGESIIVYGIPRGSPLSPRDAEDLYRRLAASGCYPYAFREGAALRVLLSKRPRRGRGPGLALLLGLATVAMLYVSGMAFESAGLGSGPAWSPWAYVAGLLAPLMVHEFGHYLTMKSLRVPGSLPIPLPAPPLQFGFLGTFGSVIMMRWLPPTATSLALVGIAGPVAGFLASLPVVYYGLHASAVVSAAQLPEGTQGLPLVPLVVMLLGATVDVPDGYYLIMSPLAFGGYVMMFVTFLNLMPIGQLDGGHIVRAALGPSGHSLVSKLFVAVLLAASLWAPSLGLFALIALFLYMISGGRHPGPALAVESLDARGVAATIIYALLLILTIPIPVG